MSSTKRERAGLDVDRDTLERCSDDDMATVREQEFQQVSLAEHNHRASKVSSTPGVCKNCGEPCLPLAVYCDVYCRDDHERRETMTRRLGRGTGGEQS